MTDRHLLSLTYNHEASFKLPPINMEDKGNKLIIGRKRRTKQRTVKVSIKFFDFIEEISNLLIKEHSEREKYGEIGTN